jgi:hypothetical protein
MTTLAPVVMILAALSMVPSSHHTRLHPSACENPNDCTAELQAALDKGGTIRLTCTAGEPWITRPLNITRNNTWLGLDAGCELLAKEGSFLGEFDALLTVRSDQAPAGCRSSCTSDGQLKPGFPGANAVRNVSVVGIGGQATLRMHRADYNDSTQYRHSEHRHGIAVLGQLTGTARSVFDVQIRDLNITLTGGDGIYIAGLNGGHIHRVQHTANYRQGSSVIDARHVAFEECTFTGTQGTPPSAGVDIEPNGAAQSFVNLTFRRCNSTGNAGAGFMMCLYHLTAESAPLSVGFEDCHVRGVGLQSNGKSIPGGGFVLSASSQNESRTWASGNVKWKGGSITDTAEEAIHISHPAPGAAIAFEQTVLARNAVNMTCSQGQLQSFPNDTNSTYRPAGVKTAEPAPVPTLGSELGRGTPNPIFVLANVFPSAGAIADIGSDGVTFDRVTVSDTLPRDFVYVSDHSRNVLGSDITVYNTKQNGCGKSIVVPRGKPSHFAAYGGNVNLSIAHCLPLNIDES